MFNVQIKNAQNISLKFPVAEVAELFVAFLIDSIIVAGYVTLATYVAQILGILENLCRDKYDPWVSTAFIIVITSPATVYPLLTEFFFNGQTLGKMVMKIKVIKIDGYQPSFFDFFIRWIFAMFEIGVMFFIAMVSILIDKYNRRIGDIVAGTVVVSLKSKANISHTILMDVEENYVPFFNMSEIVVFSDQDAQIIKNNYLRAFDKRNWKLIGKLSKKIEEVSGRENTLTTKSQYIETFIKDYNYYTAKE